MNLLALILSLPTKNATARQRIWRTLKASGAAVLRDGVYLMPERDDCRSKLNELAADVRATGGSVYVVRVEEPEQADFVGLFDRSRDYAALIAELEQIRSKLTIGIVPEMQKQVRKLRKSFAALSEIDFFPGEAKRQADSALQEIELACVHILSLDEPQAIDGVIAKLRFDDYKGRIWATRQRPWVDRLACAWLIRRFIDPQARLLWLANPADCPPDALGFDFDGATFSHIGSRVTFEVLVASFSLEQPAIHRLAQLIHFLDVGGVQPPEAAGVESVLAGLRANLSDDDQLLAAAYGVFDGLIATFEHEALHFVEKNK